SAVTTFTTPYLIKAADPLYFWIEKKLPQGIKETLTRYESAMSTTSDQGVLSLFWQEYGAKVFFNSIVVIGITLAMSRLALPIVYQKVDGGFPVDLALCIVTFVFASPFLWGVFAGRPAHNATYTREVVDQLQRLQLGVSIIRFVIGILLIGF